MRAIFSFVILFSFSCLATENSLFFERGLVDHKCYRENARYECSADCKKCTLHLFHGIKGQLSLHATDLESFCKINNADSGMVSFKVSTLNEKTVASVYGFIQVKKEVSELWIKQSNLKLTAVSCPRD